MAREHRLRADALGLVREVHADDHAVAAAARSLNASDTARAVLIEQIDQWALIHTRRDRSGALMHTETLGQVVDRLALVWTRWRLLEETALVAPQHEVREAETRVALHQVAELSGAYDDLIRDLHNGRRRLPQYQTPAGPLI